MFIALLLVNICVVFLMAFIYYMISLIDHDAFTDSPSAGETKLSERLTIIDALHYSATVHSTVGFGVLAPLSVTARFFTALHSIGIVTTALGAFSYLHDNFLKR